MRYLVVIFSIFILLQSCHGQQDDQTYTTTQDVNNTPSEDVGIPRIIASTDTSPAWNEKGIKMMVTGVVFKNDGRTPAPGVVIYYYHTNTAGTYVHNKIIQRSLPPNSKGQTHGYIRGWVKTDSNGRYAIYTIRPGVYPTNDAPAHIHLTVKDPISNTSYYIDELVFDDDKVLTAEFRKRMENRGGSGVLRMLEKDGLQIAEHNIILGLNIPGYPQAKKATIESGLSIGEDQPSFIPYHAYGADRGTRTCPVCKYGRYHGIIYFASANSSWQQITQWLVFLEKESAARSKYLKVYLVYTDGNATNKNAIMNQLATTGDSLALKHVALTYVPSFDDRETEADLNKINPAVENTFIIYKNREIVDKYLNLAPSEQNYSLLSSVLDKTKGSYFELPGLPHE